MKQKLRLMAMLWPVLILLTSMCLEAHAQRPQIRGAVLSGTVTDTITPLQIGDTIPEYLWHLPLQVVNHPEGKDTITLNDYRGKLIILDFWATWCSSCIAMMPVLHEIKQDSDNDLTVIPVTYEGKETVDEFLAKNKTVQPLGIFSAAEDSLMSMFFPHRSLPHYIWINRKGQYISQSDGDAITPDNVRLIADGGIPYWQEKADIIPQGPLFIEGNLPKETQLSGFALLLKGKVAGLTSGSGTAYRGEKRDRYYSNLPLLSIFEQVAVRAHPELAASLSSRFLVDASAEDLLERRELFTYHYIAPHGLEDALNKLALEALNAVSGYRAMPDETDATRWILFKADRKPTITNHN